MNPTPSPMPSEGRPLIDGCLACNTGKLLCDANVWHGDDKCCACCSHPEWIG